MFLIDIYIFYLTMKITPETVFFITGGASGLGEATVRRIHAAGARVAIADMNKERMEMLRNELKERIITFDCDVTSEEQVKNAVEGTVKEYGTIHSALACAGVAWPMLTYSDRRTLNMDTFKKVVDINLYGSVYVAKYVSIVMAKNKPINEMGERGVMLFVSSVAGEEGQKGQIAYSATKGAVNGMMLPMARDLGKYNIRVAAVAPGIFATPLSANMPQKVTDILNKMTPMGRAGTPDEFAHFVQVCIENSYINGVHLRLDGAIKLGHM